MTPTDRTPLILPMPGESLAISAATWPKISPERRAALDGHTVLASVDYIDDERGSVALVLLLEAAEPFYTVAHFALTDFDPAANPDIAPPYGSAYERGELDIIGRFENIVPAVEEYTQSGGDY